jgi:hypothetical protein
VTFDELDQMSQIELHMTDRTKLVDIQTIKIDTSQSVTTRMENYLKQVGNPYLFLCGTTAVHVRFEPNGEDLKCKLRNHFISIKNAEG